MPPRRSKEGFRRNGFGLGLIAGALFVAYKMLKYPGSIHRSDVMDCFALVLAFGLAGGLVALGLGALVRSSDREK